MVAAEREAGAGEPHTWTDSTGSFSVEAELVKYADGNVELRKADGSLVTVPLKRLSKEDIAYVRSRRRTTPARPEPPRTATPKGELPSRKKLVEPTNYDFANTPLTNVAQVLAEKHGIRFWIEERSLEDFGISKDLPITATCRGGPLGENLAAMLKPIRLTWLYDKEIGIIITTPEDAESRLETCVYKLVRPARFDLLIEDITTRIAPSSWVDAGGPGNIEAMPMGLVVAHSWKVHEEIRQQYQNLLRPIELPLPKPRAGRVTPRQALEQPTECDFTEAPLEDVVEHFKNMHGIKIVIDARALEDVGIGTDTPITIKMKGVRLQKVLELILGNLDLTWTMTPDSLLITTPEEEEKNLAPVSYPAADLAVGGSLDLLIEVITSSIAPISWNSVGGPGSIGGGIRGTLDVRQTYRNHMKIERLLAALRAAR
jgi:hypothetical protein